MKIVRLVVVSLTYWRIVVGTLVSNLIEYSSIVAPVYASFGIDRDIYYENCSAKTSSRLLSMECN
jgi:hypothetical protein